MLQNAPEFNSVGGGFGGWGGFGGGIGGLGLVGLVGLNNLFDRNRDHDGGARGMIGENALLAAIANSKDTTVAEGRNIANAVCEAEKTNLQQFYAAAIQASNNTQAIKDQATAFAIVNDKRFDDLAAAGVTQTAAILARINEVETQSLRDQLFLERRGRDLDVIRIENNNTNTQIQGQFQAQAQAQAQRDFDNQRRFDALFNQVAKAGQDIIAVGSVLTGTTQTANPVNVKS